ncbi:protein of unknown function [Denitratisoma oestradiolicum]|uniref:Uncharacterized protein n=1 Tax=Denitratisoma oestradiolicum TaxID=311182 RepID=A0A6S6YAU8_9PROT|nr:protein of unknown function [Denitratisoma oestradiolicum]
MKSLRLWRPNGLILFDNLFPQ